MRRIAIALCLAVLAGPSLAFAEPPAEADSVYTFRKDHHPDGTGKFYQGREIAQTMSFHGAPWLNRPEREEEEKLTTLVKLLALKPGDDVADIGAGSGVITEMLARAVGPTGQVYAVDVQPEMLKLLQERMKNAGIEQVTPVLGNITATGLKPDSVDLAIMVDVYHEFSHPREMTTDLAAAVRPGGRIVLVEYRLEDPRIPIKVLHKMSVKQVRKELGAKEFGLTWTKTFEELPRQHVIVFTRQAADQPQPKEAP